MSGTGEAGFWLLYPAFPSLWPTALELQAPEKSLLGEGAGTAL